VRVTDADRQRVHGTDERIAIRDHLDGIRFYRQLILNSMQ
jgi:acetylornithine deacetylase/succinyl-diaminopimelate desuccinylase-like protein